MATIKQLKSIDRCRSCNHKDIKPFLYLGQVPFANALINPGIAHNEDGYPLSLSWCSNCRLVQLNHTADPEKLFSKYVWVTGTSSVACNYANQFCDRALLRQKLKSGSYILEVGSNDGTFLKPFKAKGFKVLGIDPAQNIAAKANKDGIHTECNFFGEQVARSIITRHGYPQIVIARNVLPHVAHLHDFVTGMGKCLEHGALLIIEVHYAKEILAELHYDSIYHEHLCYFTLKSIEHLLKQHGIHVFHVETSPISGGSIVIYGLLEDGKKTEAFRQFEQNEIQCKANELKSWQLFADTTHNHKEKLLNLLLKEKQKGNKVVGYGASARSSTLMNFCGIDGSLLPIIADQNTMKQGLLTAGNRIPIENPDIVMKSNPDTVVILAWNFLDEIVDILKTKYDFKGEIIIPLPFPPQQKNI